MSRLLRPLAALACLLLVGSLGVGASPASASTYLLCRGYDTCRLNGYSHAGYKAASAYMWWNMIPGHNCTNYAAYRMVKSGMSKFRPWATGTGTGHAMTWGEYKASITDATPRVGAIAWWKADVPGAGSKGHVAYVEKVVSADVVVVSEDNYGGDFQWRRITRSGLGWPSGFIHFNDVPLRNTARPVVSGTPTVGEVLTTSTGTWKPAARTYTYQWRANGAAITDATGASLRLRPALRGKRITVRVTASRLGYPATSATSVATAPVDSGVLESAAPPVVTGEPRVDSTLTASAGEWTAVPTAVAYQWLADGTPVDGATESTLQVGPELVGKALSVTVTANKTGYADVSATSTATPPVAPGTLAFTARPAVTGIPRPGETLTLEPGAVASEDAVASVRWLRAGVPIEGATGPAYQVTADDLGARISARVRFSKPGYTPLGTRTPGTRRVRSVGTLRLQTTPGTGRLGVTVGVTAEGVAPVGGTVRIRSHGVVLKELTLRRGAAATTLTGLRKGLRTFRVRYVGSDTVTAAVVTRSVRIR